LGVIIKIEDMNDSKEFTNLYDQYVEKIYRFIYYKTHHKETAEDLTSATFIKALNAFGSFDKSRGYFSAWIYKIARNTVIDYYRGKKNLINIDDVWDLSGKEDIEKDIEVSLKLEGIKEYLKHLSPEQREIVILRIWEELSYKEIAQITEKSEDSCKMMFSRTIHRLREEMSLNLFLCFILFNI
jgi:RNA polymerase sigma-70 factor (ECF subfamily)